VRSNVLEQRRSIQIQMAEEILRSCESNDVYILNPEKYGLRRYDVMAPKPVQIVDVVGTFDYKTIEPEICRIFKWTKSLVTNATCDAYTGKGIDQVSHEIKWSGSRHIYINHISMLQLHETRSTDGFVAVYFEKYRKVFLFRALDIDLRYRWFRNENKQDYWLQSPAIRYCRTWQDPNKEANEAREKSQQYRAEGAKFVAVSEHKGWKQRREEREKREFMEEITREADADAESYTATMIAARKQASLDFRRSTTTEVAKRKFERMRRNLARAEEGYEPDELSQESQSILTPQGAKYYKQQMSRYFS